MTIGEAITFMIKEKVLVLQDGNYVLDSKYFPKDRKAQQARDFQQLLELYADLWPKKVKTGGRLVRRSANSLRAKLQAFVNKRKDITHEEILEATENYIKSFKPKGYEYMACADYFIMKNQSSELESYCDLLKEGNLETPSSGNLLRSLN